MTISDKLLLSVIKNDDVETLSKINKDWLDSTEVALYHTVVDYYKKHAELPGIKSFADRHSFDYTIVDSKPDYYFKELKKRYVYTSLADDVPSLLKKVKKNPLGVLEDLGVLVNELSSDKTTSTDSLYSDDALSRWEDYKERTKTAGVTYLTMGHKLLDKVFYGYKKNDLVTIGGRAGSRKTWLICYLVTILEELLPDDKGDILFVSNEMNIEEIKERMDSIRFKLPYADFLKGTLPRGLQRIYKDGLEKLSKKKSRVHIIYNCDTLNDLEFKINLYKPSICFLDGSYLMEPQMKEGWEKIVFITRHLKGITKRTIPIINTTQLKRGAGKKSTGSFDAQDDFAYGNSFVQDSDLAVTIYQDKDMVFNQEFGIQIAKGRRVDPSTKLIFCCNLTLMGFDFCLEEDLTDDEDDELLTY